MKKLPEALLESLSGIEGFDRESFLKVHGAGRQVTSIRINPGKSAIGNRQSVNEDGSGLQLKKDGDLNDLNTHYSPLTAHEQVPWSQFGFYLEQRPSFTFDPFFHGGCYYVQEASSMFLEQALKQLVDLSQPLKVLDLCGAPGGKSTHIQSLLSSGSLLVSNETIKGRNVVLIDNII